MLRLFVAAYPPAPVAEQLTRHTASLELAGLRPVPPSHIHLTVQFLGDTAARDLARIEESIARSVAGLTTPTLRIVGLRSLPDKQPHLIAAIVETDPTISEIHRRLVSRCARPSPKGRPFLPHLTTARFTPGTHHAADRAFPTPLMMDIASLSLVHSILKPTGAVHAVVSTFPIR